MDSIDQNMWSKNGKCFNRVPKYHTGQGIADCQINKYKIKDTITLIKDYICSQDSCDSLQGEKCIQFYVFGIKVLSKNMVNLKW